MSITKSEVIRGLDLFSALQALGFNVVIAGGFCRDVYFSEPPKDMDIIVAGAEMESIDAALTSLGVVHQGFHMYNEASGDRIIGGFKCEGNVDIVLYNVATALTAVEYFDFNLNQFVLMGDEFDTAYVVYAGDTSWHELEPVRKDYSMERFGKMREKFINLTWRYPENEGPARVPLSGGLFPIEP